MAVKGVSAPAAAAAGAGALVIWAGLKGASVSGSFRSLLTGQQPSGLNVNPVTGAVLTAAGGPGGTVSASTDSAIANDALRYQGAGYIWGGAPAAGPGHWDCSSFANWVIGHDERRPIPGFRAGTYTGSVHGPTTVSWAAWNGAQTIPRGQARAGDLCIWPLFHMGIAISGTQMISALNPSLGTAVTGIDRTAGGPLLIRRLR